MPATTNNVAVYAVALRSTRTVQLAISGTNGHCRVARARVMDVIRQASDRDWRQRLHELVIQTELRITQAERRIESHHKRLAKTAIARGIRQNSTFVRAGVSTA